MKTGKILLLQFAVTISIGQVPQTLPLLDKKEDRFRQAIRLERIG